MSKNIAISVKHLTKQYKLYSSPNDRLKEALNPFKKSYHKNFSALDDISFEIKKGEVVGIIGRNGSGKSTLLKILTGVLTQTDGSVHVYGKISAILELGAGFNPELTGLENIRLNMSINGLSKENIDAKIEEVVEFAELGEFINQPTKTYSSGMHARLGFSVAINIDPDILIVDEALSVGDAAFQRKCFAKMEEIRDSGATILFVSHSEASIVSLCDRAIWLSNGKQILDGLPKLVTGLYLKHINSKNIDSKRINEEHDKLLQAEKDSDIKNTKEKATKEESIEEFYNPALKPKSTIYYEEKGAKISDVKITTLDGKEVNVLIQGKKYYIEYKVTIEQTGKFIFGCHIDDIKGINLSGGVYPSLINNNEFINANKKENLILRFLLDVHFNENNYFLSCIIRNNEGEFVHRIKDIYMFKVRSNNNNSNCFTNAITPMGIIN